MYTVNIGHDDIDFAAFDEAAHYMPSGFDVWEGRQERFDLTRLKCYRELRDSRRIERSLGTLGGGNHFIKTARILLQLWGGSAPIYFTFSLLFLKI